MNATLKVEKLVNGGQALATLPDGKKVFLWNALPGEVVEAELSKSKKGFSEGLAVKIIEASPERVEPREPDIFVSTSPWQILDYTAENNYKKAIATETFEREKVKLPDFDMVATEADYGYRSKMEFSFYGDDDGLHLALYNRGTHRKIILQGSALAIETINIAARQVVEILNQHKVRASSLKSLILRCDQSSNTVAALFVKDQAFPKLSSLPSSLHGLAVYFSNPKSPASIITKELQLLGDIQLSDNLIGHKITYDVNCFFQVNLPIFERALIRIKEFAGQGPIVDMYSGVGSIGLSLGVDQVKLVELDQCNVEFARQNSGNDIEVVQASTEKALDYIDSQTTIIFDPPRAGLHKDVIERILDTRPPKLIYLSCNPITQARDLKLLEDSYKIECFEGYNFFPHTPHIETLAILTIN